MNRTFVAIAPILLLVALPARAGIGDKTLPLLAGQKTKLYYTLNGVSDTPQIATVIFCNNTGVGQGTANVLPGRTLTFVTKATAAFTHDEVILGSGAADKVEVQLAYAIGVADPVSIMIERGVVGR